MSFILFLIRWHLLKFDFYSLVLNRCKAGKSITGTDDCHCVATELFCVAVEHGSAYDTKSTNLVVVLVRVAKPRLLINL